MSDGNSALNGFFESDGVDRHDFGLVMDGRMLEAEEGWEMSLSSYTSL